VVTGYDERVRALVVAVLVLAACDPATPPPPDAGMDAGVDSATDADTSLPMRPDRMPMDTGTFFEALYGGIERVVPGAPCNPADDRCRGNESLYVCLDMDRDPMGADPTCIACESDDECRAEYPYIDFAVTCGTDGKCKINGMGGDSCTAAGGVCVTGRAGSFACIGGHCAQCISADECVAEYGADWECDFSRGSCEPATAP